MYATAAPASGEVLTDLYRDHAGPLYGYARFLTPSVQDAEDLVQVTFMQAYRSLEAGDEFEHPRAWLMTTMRRRAFNLARDRRDVASDELSSQADIADVSSSAALNEQIAAVRTALEQLPESQRHAFVLRHWSGLSAQEIAEVMDTSEPSVQSLLSRARATLRSDRKLARATEAITASIFVPTQRLTDKLGELIPGFGSGEGTVAGTGALAAGTIGAGKAAMAIKGALAVVAATGVLAVGHERHIDSKALQAVGIEQTHHHGRGSDDRAGSDDHGGASGHSGKGSSGEAEPNDDHGGGKASGSGSGDDGGTSGKDSSRGSSDDAGVSGKGASSGSGSSGSSGSSGGSGSSSGGSGKSTASSGGGGDDSGSSHGGGGGDD